MWFTHTGSPLPLEMALLQSGLSPTPWRSKKAMHESLHQTRCGSR
jgi:hypothetical protein